MNFKYYFATKINAYRQTKFIFSKKPHFTMSPKVTVIIASYNSKATLFYSISSVLNQSFKEFELWVIGDACTDATEELIKSFHDERLCWYNLKTNSGSQPKPNNEGLKRAKGKHVAYLGHDDLWMPHHLENLYRHCEENQQVFSFSMVLQISPDGRLSSNRKAQNPFTDSKVYSNPSSWMHSLSLIDKVGYWNENYNELDEPCDVNFFNKMFETTKEIVPCYKISVLKFPSVLWASYDHKSQIKDTLAYYWDQILADSKQLEINLLNGYIYQNAQSFNDIGFMSKMAKAAFHKFRYLAKKLPWLKPVSVYIYQQRLKRSRKLRGLHRSE